MKLVRRIWRFVRQLSGDDAYERYVHTHHCPHHTPLSRREFYLRRQQEKWSGIQRCC